MKEKKKTHLWPKRRVLRRLGPAFLSSPPRRVSSPFLWLSSLAVVVEIVVVSRGRGRSCSCSRRCTHSLLVNCRSLLETLFTFVWSRDQKWSVRSPEGI